MGAPKYDAVIVGSGPAGSAAAKRLTEAGAKTLIVEKEKLPRHKNCSGLISHEALDFVSRNFGEIPNKVKSTSGDYLGIALHFPHAPSLYLDAMSPVPNVWRNGFDYFLAQKSGSSIKDRLLTEEIIIEKNGVVLKCRNGRKQVTLKAAYVVAADGGASTVVQKLAPGIHNEVPWTVAYQRYYRGSVDLEKGYFHTFFNLKMGIYVWLSFKDDFLLIGTAIPKGEKIESYYGNLIEMLKKRHGLVIPDKPEMIQGCLGNAMGPLHRFYLGRERVLVAGEAAGFLHMGGEGITAALISGAAAGDTVVKALSKGKNGNIVDVYRDLVKTEIEKTRDQWNLLKMVDSSTLKMKPPPNLREDPVNNLKRLYDILAFLKQGKGTGIGKAILLNTIEKAYKGRYSGL